MNIWKPARMLVVSVSLGIVVGCGVYAATPSTPVKPRFRSPEEAFYSDIRPATPDQRLPRTLEKKADAQASFIEGILSEEQGDYEQALNAYTQSLALDPGGNPQLAVRVAHEFVKRGDVAQGINILKDLAKVRPREPLAYLNLAYFYFRQLNKPSLAVTYAEKAVRIDPKNLAAYQSLFELYMTLKRKKEAESVITRAEKNDSKNPAYWLSLTDLAIQLYRSDNNPFPAAKAPLVIRLLEKATRLAGDDANTNQKIADDYVLIDQVNSAIPLYLKTIELNKSNPEVRYKLAESFVKAGQRDQAIRMLEEMLKSNPLKSEIYEFRARLYLENGNKEHALADYEQAILLAPQEPENYLHAAELDLQLKQNDRAIATLQEARHRFPIPQITYALAVGLSTAKRYSEALPVYEAALQEAKSGQQEIIDGNFYFNYGVTAEQAGLVDKAAGLLKKSIELDPSKSAQAYNYLGYMWIDRNLNLDEAGTMIRKALEIEPDNGAYLDSLGWYYFKKGEFSKALNELLHAADRVHPADPTVFEHIGDAYRSLGNVGQALNYWQKALKLDPQNQGLASKTDEAKAKYTANPVPSAPAPVSSPSPSKSAPVPSPSPTPSQP
jgi:tetratricopeptide (TPR) repeat protein